VRVLIAGGAGFIGGRLARHLQQKGHQVVLGSRQIASAPDWLPQAEVALVEWGDALALERICSGIDVVIQAAGMNAQDCSADPVAALEFNGAGTARLLSAACQSRAKRFIYLSTAHVYASPLTGVITEETCPRNLHPYATSHLAGEHAVLSADQRGQIEGIVLRLSNAFGAPTHKEVNCWMLLVNDLCRQALMTNRMVLHSSGLQPRDFVSMEQVCRVIEKLSSRSADKLPTNIFNVGSGISLSVLEMARLIQHRCKLFSGIEPKLSFRAKGLDEIHEALEFRTTQLQRMRIVVDYDIEAEIDGLLAFCQESFHASGSEEA